MMKELNIQMVRQAQAGNKQSLSEVSEQAQRKVYIYIYRLTLDYHLTQDLTQETVLDMIKAFPKLKVPHINGFWAWIFRTALGKVQHHYRPQGARRLAKKTTTDYSVLKSRASNDYNPMKALVSGEIRNAVFNAMKAIEFKYRNILVLRCFDNMSYGQIAGIMGGSELKARLLFFRAKHSLKNQLERRGFKRNYLLAALTIFAELTVQNSKKAIAGEVVLASSLETGLGIGLASLLTVKTAVTAACVLFIAGFTISMITPDSSNATVNTTQDNFYSHLYGHLYPLLDRAEFVSPSRIIDAHDPDKDGFLVVEQRHPELARQRLQTDQIRIDLVNRPRFGPALPKGHWIDLGFDGPIRDGPGPDLLLRVQGCRSLIRVFVTDGANRLYELRKPRCLRIGVCRREHILDFDLDGLALPFEPRAVRILGAVNWGPYGGIRFYSLHARIQKPEPSQP